MSESATNLAALRRIAAIGHRQAAGCAGLSATTGHAGIDAVLGGGLARARLHEVFAAGPGDAGSAAGFAAMLALRLHPAASPLIWLRTDSAERRAGRLYVPGLAELGLDPAALVVVLAPDNIALLRCAADAARCAGFGAVLVECWGNARELDLTASRRLMLAAEKSGVAMLLLRIDATPGPSAAETRWSVHAAPSLALEANAPGQTMLEIELLRRRAGPSGWRWRVEWNRDERAFKEPPLSGAVVSLSQRGTAEDLPAAAFRRTA